MTNYLGDARIDAVLTRLYKLDQRQNEDMTANPPPRGDSVTDPIRKKFMSDKLVALEPDKAEFCYRQIRERGAKRVVECGTSYGVSTIYLAAAIRANGGGVVIGTEYEPEKAAAARHNWAEAGIADYIDLREGDLRETLKDCGGPVDFVLMDIWTTMARPALDLLIPQLSKGAIIVADNIDDAKVGYADYISRVRGVADFRSETLPMKGGVEVSTYTG